MMFDFSQLQALFSQIGEEWSPRNKETVCEALWQYYSEFSMQPFWMACVSPSACTTN